MRNLTYRALRISEKYLKTDMVYVAKGSFWLVLGQVLTIIGTLVFSIVIAHAVSKETFGLYSFIFSIVQIVMAFSLSGLGTAVTRAVAIGHEGEFKKAVQLNLRWSGLTSLLFLVLAGYYFWAGNMVISSSLFLAGLFTCLIDSGKLYGAFLGGKKDFAGTSIFQTIRSLSSFLVVGLMAYFTQSVIWMVLGYFVANLAAVGVGFFYTWYKYKPNSVQDDGESLHLGKNLSVINLFATVADSIDKVLAFHFLGAAPLAIYNYAVAIPDAFNGFIKNIGSLATPKISTKRDQTSKQLGIFQKTFMVSLLIVGPVTVYYFVAEYIYTFFFPQYLESVKYSTYYMFAMVVNGSIPIAFLDAHKAIKEKYILVVSSSILKVVFMVLGTYFYGLLGLVMARIISKVFGLATSLILVKMVDKHIL